MRLYRDVFEYKRMSPSPLLLILLTPLTHVPSVGLVSLRPHEDIDP